MRAVFLALLSVAALQGADTLTVFGKIWTVPSKADWQIAQEGGQPMLHMAAARNPLPGPRRPIQFALLEKDMGGDVTVDVDVRPLQRSCILVFAYKDEAHFDYAHLSVDTGVKQPVHNGIFHVFGGERVRISDTDGPAAFAASNRWYHVTLRYSAQAGNVAVSVDGREVPALHAVDLSLHGGRIGLGSFDETGDYKNLAVKTSAS